MFSDAFKFPGTLRGTYEVGSIILDEYDELEILILSASFERLSVSRCRICRTNCIYYRINSRNCSWLKLLELEIKTFKY